MNELPLSILDSYEHYTCSKRIHNLALAALNTDNYVKSLCSQIFEGLTGMEQALGKSLKSEFTPLLVKYDNLRDKAFLGFKSYVHTFTLGRDAAKAQAAAKLEHIIANTGNNIHRLGYGDETAKMNALILALGSAEAKGWIEAIGAAEWYNDIVNTQKEFENVYKTKVDSEAVIDLPLLKESKKKITNALKPLLAYIESNVGLNGEVFAPLEAQINEVITEIKAIARARITRVENEKKAEEVKN